MKLTVLVDNNVLTDRYFYGEPGLSLYIEDGEIRVLFDLGYSGIFNTNAQKMGIDLLRTDYVVLSHAHLDHTWGLDPLIRLFTEAKIEGRPHTEPVFIAHPDLFISREYDGTGEIGCLISADKLALHGELKLTKDPFWITDNLVFLGEIERCFDFEGKYPIGTVNSPSGRAEDYIIDDSALAYKTPEGIIVITGCAHSGICATIEQAKRICGDDRVLDIIGGFHLLNASEEQMEGTLAYLRSIQPRNVYACHCTDLNAKIALAGAVNLKESGVGLQIIYQ